MFSSCYPSEITSQYSSDLSDTEVPPEDGSRLQSIQQLATQKLERVSDAQLSFSIGGRCVVVREVVRKVFKLVTTYKDVINSAISSEPHAALAWAGVMVVLPVRSLFQRLPPSYRQLSHFTAMRVAIRDHR